MKRFQVRSLARFSVAKITANSIGSFVRFRKKGRILIDRQFIRIEEVLLSKYIDKKCVSLDNNNNNNNNNSETNPSCPSGAAKDDKTLCRDEKNICRNGVYIYYNLIHQSRIFIFRGFSFVSNSKSSHNNKADFLKLTSRFFPGFWVI